MVAARQLKKGDFSMTESNHQTTSKTPSHIVYHIRNREGGEGFWTRIGSAWAHKDGHGFNIQLETLPIDGRITLRVPSEKTE
jgi:hypothetical protein